MADVIRDGSIAGQIPAIPQLLPAAAGVFAARAERFDTLAAGHSLEGYLRFAAALSRAQEGVLAAAVDLPVPGEELLAHCRAHDLPPLGVDGHRRDPVWREMLGALIRSIEPGVMTDQAASAAGRLQRMSADALESAATNVLSGAYGELDPAIAPFLAAGLQVYWTGMALRLDGRVTARPAQIGLCPVCGSHPTASVVRIGGAVQGLRYLTCSLCCSEWHMVRIKCSACGSTKGISYFGIEGGSDAVKAECCGECKTYLKIFHLEKDTSLVPAADDLATLALDVLVDQEGYNRLGPNLLFVPGTP